MHATAIAARPAIMYWQPASLALLEQVYALRRAGVPAWATMDAGPHVKVLTTASAAAQIAEALRSVPGCTDAIIGASGPGAHVA